MPSRTLPAIERDARWAGALKRVQDAAGDASIDDGTCMALGVIVYKKDGANLDWSTLGAGWELLAKSPNGDFDARALYHAASRSLVVVNRGTEGFSAIEDLLEAFKAATFNRWDGPLLDGLNFLLETYAAFKDKRVIERVLCVGHSWGGALADGQVAVGGPLLVKAGFGGEVRGVGFGSAGFGGAIKTLAEKHGVALDRPEVKASMRHFVRARDGICATFSNTIGSRIHLASIFRSGPRPPRKQDNRVLSDERWRADRLENHTSLYYLDFRDLTDAEHLYVRSDGIFVVHEGQEPRTDKDETPPPYAFP